MPIDRQLVSVEGNRVVLRPNGVLVRGFLPSEFVDTRWRFDKNSTGPVRARIANRHDSSVELAPGTTFHFDLAGDAICEITNTRSDDVFFVADPSAADILGDELMRAIRIAAMTLKWLVVGAGSLVCLVAALFMLLVALKVLLDGGKFLLSVRTYEAIQADPSATAVLLALLITGLVGFSGIIWSNLHTARLFREQSAENDKKNREFQTMLAREIDSRVTEFGESIKKYRSEGTGRS
ncbi:MAG TPA: hypothetical protein VGQ37_05000 [Vicinamibacterales bacterium]|jgi:hypothetical protein|nr:hypothetical protein [Vicinamibacterales bacterium]